MNYTQGLSLPIEFDDGKYIAKHETEFLVVDSWLPYTVILSLPTLSTLRMVTSQPHLKAKFITSTGVGVCCRDQNGSRELYVKALKCCDVCTVETLEEGNPKESTEPAKAIDRIQRRKQLGSAHRCHSS